MNERVDLRVSWDMADLTQKPGGRDSSGMAGSWSGSAGEFGRVTPPSSAQRRRRTVDAASFSPSRPPPDRPARAGARRPAPRHPHSAERHTTSLDNVAATEHVAKKRPDKPPDKRAAQRSRLESGGGVGSVNRTHTGTPHSSAHNAQERPEPTNSPAPRNQPIQSPVSANPTAVAHLTTLAAL